MLKVVMVASFGAKVFERSAASSHALLQTQELVTRNCVPPKVIWQRHKPFDVLRSLNQGQPPCSLGSVRGAEKKPGGSRQAALSTCSET